MKKRKIVEFEAGDVVVLKSGGPRMTVVSVCAGTVDCSWFAPDENSDPCIAGDHSYPAAALDPSK